MTEPLPEYTATVYDVTSADSRNGTIIVAKFRTSAPFATGDKLECQFIVTSLNPTNIRLAATKAIATKMRSLYEAYFREQMVAVARTALLDQTLTYSFRTAE